VVPRHVGDEVFDHRERLERLHRDRLVGPEHVHARHARQLRLAVDLHRARAALAGLAVPAQREIVGLRRLDAMQDVEHDHAGLDLDFEALEVTARGVATPDLELPLAHSISAPTLPDSISSIFACASSLSLGGGSGRLRFSISIPFAPFLTITLYWTHSS